MDLSIKKTGSQFWERFDVHYDCRDFIVNRFQNSENGPVHWEVFRRFRNEFLFPVINFSLKHTIVKLVENYVAIDAVSAVVHKKQKLGIERRVIK